MPFMASNQCSALVWDSRSGRYDNCLLREKRPLGNHIQAGEQSQSFVEHRTHDMQVPVERRINFRASRLRNAVCGRDPFRAGKITPIDQSGRKPI